MRPRSRPPHRAAPPSAAPLDLAAGDADDPTQSLPQRHPRLAMPFQLPAAAAGCVLLTHFVLAGALLAGWAPSDHLLLAISALLGLAVSGTVLLALGNRLEGRIERIAKVLERAQAGDYAHRVDAGLQDDIGILARRVNLLAETSAAREKRIMESALSDPLTGLPNRTLLTERIRHSLAMSRRSRAPFAIAVLDLDRFKFVNDTLGHAAGDMVLVEVANRLRGTVRDSDTVARLGGDEFVLLLQGGEDAAREVTSRIVEAMKAPLRHRDQLIDIGVSMGIAIHPQHGADDLTLLRHADSAMYRAKRRRAGIAFFDGDPQQEVRRSYLSMLGELRTALEGGQLVLDYQPKMDLVSGLIVGLEGLLRWHHPTRGRVQPAEFIPFAEQTGFMREITRWVVGEGACFAGELARRDMQISVSVNVSAQDLEDTGFADGIAHRVRSLQLEPGRLTLEITESGLLSETEVALGNLRSLAALGVRLSVDDFGTGYATLKQLQNLPVHELKVDRSFVSGMGQNRGSQAIVRSTVDLGRQLGLRVTAEGVETLAELRALAEMGCHEIQGYYLAKPMPAAEVVAWIEMRHALHASSREGYFRMLVERTGR